MSPQSHRIKNKKRKVNNEKYSGKFEKSTAAKRWIIKRDVGIKEKFDGNEKYTLKTWQSFGKYIMKVGILN